MFFNRKAASKELLDNLKKRPNEMLVSSVLVGIYLSDSDKYLIIMGDFTNYSEEELNQLVVRRFEQLQAQKN
jgi:hypothetical protein